MQTRLRVSFLVSVQSGNRSLRGPEHRSWFRVEESGSMDFNITLTFTSLIFYEENPFFSHVLEDGLLGE